MAALREKRNARDVTKVKVKSEGTVQMVKRRGLLLGYQPPVPFLLAWWWCSFFADCMNEWLSPILVPTGKPSLFCYLAVCVLPQKNRNCEWLPKLLNLRWQFCMCKKLFSQKDFCVYLFWKIEAFILVVEVFLIKIKLWIKITSVFFFFIKIWS